jgi:hypothetical protein
MAVWGETELDDGKLQTAIQRGACPLWVISGHRRRTSERLLYPGKQTSGIGTH